MNKNILAVDDEPDMLKLLERIITRRTGYTLVTVNNSLEVPELLEKEEFDIILTDLMMPGLSGLEILQMVKEQGRKEEVIIMTAFGSFDTVMEALGHGVFDYITKPFKKEEILFALDRALRWQRIKREAERMDAIFETEPLKKAIRAFEGEYVRRLMERCDGDASCMAARAGLPREKFEEMRKKLAEEE